jgi:hypothetical protein
MELLAYMMVIHFIADFLLQSREMGQKKSSEPIWLIRHLLIQYFVFAILLSPFLGLAMSMLFALCNALIHGVIDWYIWRGYKWSVSKRIYDDKGNPYVPGVSEGYPNHSLMSDADNSFNPPKAPEWRYWLDHWFYATIGLDQLLHA